MATNFEQARSIFMAALERDPAAWESYLAEACGDDAQLRQAVNRLLDAHRSRSGPLDDVTIDAGEPASPARSCETAGSVIAGRYELIEAIGEGAWERCGWHSSPNRSSARSRLSSSSSAWIPARCSPALKPSGRRWR